MSNKRIATTVVVALFLAAFAGSSLGANLSGTWASKQTSAGSASVITIKQSGNEVHVLQKLLLGPKERTIEYRLKTKWEPTEIPAIGGVGTRSARAKLDGEKLIVHWVQERGKVRVEQQETWTVSRDGKILTVTSVTEGPRGKETSTVEYTRQ